MYYVLKVCYNWVIKIRIESNQKHSPTNYILKNKLKQQDLMVDSYPVIQHHQISSAHSSVLHWLYSDKHVTCIPVKLELLTCLSFTANRVHSAPSLLVISGKGRSGYLARICSRRSFRKRTYPVTGALGPFGRTFFLFFPFGQPLFFGCREEEHCCHEGWGCSVHNYHN